jgi:hypothetical protein
MAGDNGNSNKSTDPAVQEMIAKAESMNVVTVYRFVLPELPAGPMPHRSIRRRA